MVAGYRERWGSARGAEHERHGGSRSGQTKNAAAGEHARSEPTVPGLRSTGTLQVRAVLACNLSPEVIFELTHRCDAPVLFVVAPARAIGACAARPEGLPTLRRPPSVSARRGRPARAQHARAR